MDNVVAFPTKKKQSAEPSFVQALDMAVDWVIDRELPDSLSSTLLTMTNDPIRHELDESNITDVAFEYIPPGKEDELLNVFNVASTVRTKIVPHYAVQMFKDFLTFAWMDVGESPKTDVMTADINWVAEFTRIFASYIRCFPAFVSGNAMMFCFKFLQTIAEQPGIQCLYGLRSERHQGSVLEFGFCEKLEDGKWRLYTLFIDFLPFVLDDSALKLSGETSNN